jgi:hypothetical protein
MIKIFNKYKCTIDSSLHLEFINEHNFKEIGEVVDFILNRFNLNKVEYIGDNTNRFQYNELIKNKFIKLTGDLENDTKDFKITDLLFVILTKNIPLPYYNRSFTLYFKNEHNLTPGIVDEYEFLLHYKILERLIAKKFVKNFNAIRVICRHTSPEYIDSLNCEKITTEVGAKKFELLTSVYSNPIFYFNGTLNFSHLKSRAILTPQCYEINTCPSEATYEKYNYISFDFSIKDKIEDSFKWCDGTVTGVKDRFFDRKNDYTIEQKLCDFVQCVLNIDKTPLCI